MTKYFQTMIYKHSKENIDQKKSMIFEIKPVYKENI